MIQIASKNLLAEILPYGATLSGVWYRDAAYSLVLGSPDESAYGTDLQYFGSLVGPIANRVGGAEIDIDGVVWRMDPNEGTTCLHSGHDGIHGKYWHVTDQSEDSVVLSLDLDHGAAGLPGNRRFTARYQVTDESDLRLSLSATSDADTVVNLAHHPYWNLDGSEDIRNHSLVVHASHYLPVNEKLLPTGEVLPVANGPFDFSSATKVPTHWALDHNFCLSDHPRELPSPAAILRGASGIALHIKTTEPGLQVYNGSGLTDHANTLHDKRTLRPNAGIALEPQAWPDAPNHTHFPPVGLCSGEFYRQETIYRFSQNCPDKP